MTSPEPVAPDANRIEVVPYVPPRCYFCGAKHKRTYGQAGRLRYHRCLGCGRKYRSLELEPDEVRRRLAGWFRVTS